MSVTELVFPPGFLWGVSTSPYQSDGGINNDWGQFAHQQAEVWAKKNAKNPDPRIPPAKRFLVGNPTTYIWDYGLGHWDSNEFRDFVEFYALRGLGILRIGIDWGRVYSDPEAWQTYRRKLKIIRQSGLKTMVTLWHWTNPRQYSALETGWTSGKILSPFDSYCQDAVHQIGDLVDYWVTMNEIGAYAARGYLEGVWIPGKKLAVRQYRRVVHHLIAGHELAAERIWKEFPGIPLSVAQANPLFRPSPDTWYNQALARRMERWNNHHILDRVLDSITYIGLNHYGALYVNIVPLEKFDDEDWTTIYPVIMDAYHRYQLPILVTENGIVDTSDQKRQQFIPSTLRSVHSAIKDGADVRGYLHWTGDDGNEWSAGDYTLLMGLSYQDPFTRKRTSKPSLLVYESIIRRNAVPAE